MTQYLDFVDLNYKPKNSDLICLFRVEPSSRISMREAMGRIASESSNGTWTTLSTLKEHIRRIRARAFELKNEYVKIAYPVELFELGSVPQMLSSFAGNVFGMKAVKNLRLEDIDFPKTILKSFRGPEFGIKGVRKIFKVYDRPLTASVPKPKVGMTTKEYGKVANDVWAGGVDLLKDDENLTNQNFNRFNKRAKTCFKIRDKVEKETGERKSYLINVSAETSEMLKRAKLVHELGGEFVMIDVLTCGFASFQTLREFCHDNKMAIHIHRAMHAAFTRNPKHGISMIALAKLIRLVGGDNLHIGTVVGKLFGKKDEILTLEREIEHNIDDNFLKQNVLKERWHHIKPMFAVSSGGLHPGLIPYVLKLLGKDIIVQAGGGIHGHPQGSRAGAMALMQAIDAVISGINLSEYAKKNLELKEALNKWEYNKPV